MAKQDLELTISTQHREELPVLTKSDTILYALMLSIVPYDGKYVELHIQDGSTSIDLGPFEVSDINRLSLWFYGAFQELKQNGIPQPGREQRSEK